MSSLDMAVKQVTSFFAVGAKPQLRELYLFVVLFSFAQALVAVFEPIFFYKQGLSLAWIAFYYALHYTLYTLVIPWGARFAARFGLERSLAVAMPIFVAYFLTLALIPLRPELFWVAPFLLTAHKMFYWPAYHANFTKHSDRKNQGTEISYMMAITSGVGILGPLVGGFVAALFGFPVLFVLAAITTLLAGMPLLATKERFRPARFPYATGWRIIFSRQHRRLALGMPGFGEQLVNMVFWPIFLVLIFGELEVVGVVASVSVLVATLLGFIVGELGDRYTPRRVVRWGLPVLLIGFLVRVLILTPLQALGGAVLAEVGQSVNKIPVLAILYANGKRAGALVYALALEQWQAAVKAGLAWGLMVLFSLVSVEVGFQTTFTIGAAFAFLYLFL